jgi:hypothetical protein
MEARSAPPGGELGAEPSALGETDPVAVFRVRDIVEGWIPKLEGRMSDGLNDAERMRMRTPGPDGTSRQWMELDLDDVVAVAAPPRPPSPARVARRQHAIEIDAGPYHMRGTAHLPLGADPRRYVSATGRRWLPLTDCTVAVGNDAYAVDVVIVNMDYASRRHDSSVSPPFG